MKIYSAPDLHKIDQNTIEQEGITSLELMERAASAVVYEIVSRYPRNKDICSNMPNRSVMQKLFASFPKERVLPKN